MVLTLERATKKMAENGGSLDLRGCTGLTALPDGLTVGGSLYLDGCTGLTNIEEHSVNRLQDGDYEEGRYLYADGILTHVKKKKELDGYTLYVGKIPGKNVASDGKNYAHCATFREGIADLLFKAAAERGADQYKTVKLSDTVTAEEAKTMYRIITGACRQGTEAFVNSLGELKESYTVGEVIELTRGQYGSDGFAQFFGGA